MHSNNSFKIPYIIKYMNAFDWNKNMIREAVSDHLRLPKDVILGATIMHITGMYEIYIENYKNIIEYNNEFIHISGRDVKIGISGKNLYIEYFNNNDMKIKGRIQNINFET